MNHTTTTTATTTAAAAAAVGSVSATTYLPIDSPSHELYTAYTAYQNRSMDANQLIKQCVHRNIVVVGVNQLLDIILHKLIGQLHIQQLYLSCCHYCMLYQYNDNPAVINKINSILYSQIKLIHILNLFHKYNIDIHYDTYNKYGMNGVISQLMALSHYGLAFDICHYLSISNNDIIIQWCTVKLHKLCTGNTSLTELQVSDVLIQKLMKTNQSATLDVRSICYVALQYKKSVLYDILLNYSSNIQHQIELLLHIRKHEHALHTAITSNNSRYVYHVLFNVLDMNNDQLLIDLLKQYHVQLLPLYINYLQSMQNYEEIKLTYYILQYNILAGHIQSRYAMKLLVNNTAVPNKSMNTDGIDQVIANLSLANELYKKTDPHNYYVQCTDTQILLLHALIQQDKYNTNTNTTNELNYNMTVFDLYKYFVRYSYIDKAAQLVKLYSITDHIQILLKLNVYIKYSMFIQLDILFNTNRKLYINMYLTDIIDQLIQYKHHTESIKYIQYLNEYHEQMEYLCSINYWVQAAQIAVKHNDYSALLLIRQKCKQLYAQKQIDQLIDKFQHNNNYR